MCPLLFLFLCKVRYDMMYNGKDERWRAENKKKKEKAFPSHPLDLFVSCSSCIALQSDPSSSSATGFLQALQLCAPLNSGLPQEGQ